MLILQAHEVLELLDQRRSQVIEVVREAYMAHADNRTVVPHSLFLRCGEENADRIIALPACLRDDEGGGLGVKWISSFPGNIARGMRRASGVIILNSISTGQPEAILEASAISAYRTAASAAAAVDCLRHPAEPATLTLVGCGVINFEITTFVRLVCPSVQEIVLYDTDRHRSERFGERVRTAFPSMSVTVAPSSRAAMEGSCLISIATTAVRPHIDTLSMAAPGALVLHISLRDLTSAAILSAWNVTDDPAHACREQTSLHLTAQQTSHTDFIHAAIGDILTGRAPAPYGDGRPTVFSPFGLGVLDIAVARLIARQAIEQGSGLQLSGFLPAAEPAIRDLQPAQIPDLTGG